MSRETRMIETVHNKNNLEMLLHLKKLLKKQIKIILVHNLFPLELSIHVTFSVRKFYVLES